MPGNPPNPRPHTAPQMPSTHLDGVHHQACSHHAQTREQKGHRNLARDGEGGLGEDPVGGPGELTAEASQLLALEAELQIQLGDHHGQAVKHSPRSKTSRPRQPSVLCPPHPQQDTFPKKPAQVERPGALRLWKVPQEPLSQTQSKQMKRKGLCDSASFGA